MKTHDYVHLYCGYWSDGGVCRIRIYEAEDREPVVICSELPDNDNTSVTNMAEYIAAEVIEEHNLPTPFTWIEHYPRDESQRRAGLREEWDLVTFSSYEIQEVRTASGWRMKIGAPDWKPSGRDQVEELIGDSLHACQAPDAPDEANVALAGECRKCGRALSNPVSVQGVEAALGRVGQGEGAEKRVKVYLLLYGEQVVREPHLSVPHPKVLLSRNLRAIADMGRNPTIPEVSVADLLAKMDLGSIEETREKGWINRRELEERYGERFVRELDAEALRLLNTENSSLPFDGGRALLR
jgi:7,8-dihydro-6-hydroxymethylpterin-pyrophosphokinase